MPTQQCPNCQRMHDVGVYVTGQKVRCACGLHFQVRRTDVSMVGSTRATVARSAMQNSPKNDTVLRPVPLDRTFVATAAAAARISVPGYELQEMLGKGGMGEVWRAVQQSLGRLVAVKILPPKLAEDPEFVTRFEKEASALAALSHPNIVQIIDRGVADEHYFFVMEYVQGRSLRELVSEGPVTPARAVKIIADICAAIDHAHEQQIIHRDLKPENILIDVRGHVKVADFGLAGMKTEDARLQLTATKVAMGTINYMAPEQRRDAKHVDGRADLFSLGVMLYELLTGEIPVGRFELPSAKIPELDPHLDVIVERTLAQDPEGRYARASLVAQALEQVLQRMQGTAPLASVIAIHPDRPMQHADASPVTTIPGRVGHGATPRVPATSAAKEPRHRWTEAARAALVVLVIAAVGLTVKFWPKIASATGLAKTVITEIGPSAFPPNTDGELFSTFAQSNEGAELSLSFDEGDEESSEEINAHSGTWKLEQGTLKVVQAGEVVASGKLIPRAYLAHRYYSSDDFTAEVLMAVKPLQGTFKVGEDAQLYGELAFRIKDLQVSAFAIPGTGMRLMWRYISSDGVEIVGNSARDLMDLVEDEMPVPPNGQPFRVTLSLRRKKTGTDVEAFVNGQRFARKHLVGLEGQVGKVALGCRNLACEFDQLTVRGKVAQRPARKSE